MPITQQNFLREYGFIYNFLGLGNINSRFIVIGLQEKATGNYENIIDFRKIDKKDKYGNNVMKIYKDKYYFCPNTLFFNENKSCNYWDNALKTYQTLGFLEIGLGDIFFTELDPFARDTDKTNILEKYNIIDGSINNLFNNQLFNDRKQNIINLISDGIDGDNKIILIVSYGDNKKTTSIDYIKNNLEIEYMKNSINIENKGYNNNYRIGKIKNNLGKYNYIIECPHFSYTDHIGSFLEEIDINTINNIN